MLESQPFMEQIQNDEAWTKFTQTIVPKASEYLGDEGFPWMCRLLEWEREGFIDRCTAYNLVCNVVFNGAMYERNTTTGK